MDQQAGAVGLANVVKSNLGKFSSVAARGGSIEADG